jgi:hypothetical protein
MVLVHRLKLFLTRVACSHCGRTEWLSTARRTWSAKSAHEGSDFIADLRAGGGVCPSCDSETSFDAVESSWLIHAPHNEFVTRCGLPLFDHEFAGDPKHITCPACAGRVDTRGIMKGDNTNAPAARQRSGAGTEGMTSMKHEPTNDGLILRTARKRWDCAGDGRATNPEHSVDCPGVIEPGDQYIECLWESPAYESGTRHTLPCARVMQGWTDA